MEDSNNIRNRKLNLYLFFCGQILSLFGTSLLDYAVIWFITLQTKSSVVMALGIICAYVPRILISFFSGIWADRYDRKKLIVYADVFNGIAILIFAAFFFIGYQNIGMIFFFLSLKSIGSGIRTPASGAIIPLIVPDTFYSKVNGINSSIQSVVLILSPALGGVLLSFCGLDAIALITSFLLLISIIFILSLNIKNDSPNQTLEQKSSYIDDFMFSYRYISKNAVIKLLIYIYIAYFFFTVPISLLAPLKIARDFGNEVWRLSLNETLFSVGSMIGGAIIWLVPDNKEKKSLLLIGASFIILGLACGIIVVPSFGILLFAMLLAGIFISVSNSTTVTIFQKKTEVKFQGRIFGLVQILTISANLTGSIVFGILGDIIPLNYIYIVTAVFFIMLGLFTCNQNKILEI